MKQTRLAKELKAHGAVLKRQRKHPVYTLPNGRNFVTSATPSDHRTEKNAIRDLRKAAGISRKSPIEPPPPEPEVLITPATIPPPIAAIATPDAPFIERIRHAVKVSEERSLQLMREEDRIKKEIDRENQRMNLLLPWIELMKKHGVEYGEETLIAMLPPKAVEPSKPTLPPTERIFVTREAILNITKTLEGNFTLNNILDKMIEGHTVSVEERKRTRASIQNISVSLIALGQILKVQEGRGKAPAIFTHPQAAAAQV